MMMIQMFTKIHWQPYEIVQSLYYTLSITNKWSLCLIEYGIWPNILETQREREIEEGIECALTKADKCVWRQSMNMYLHKILYRWMLQIVAQFLFEGWGAKLHIYLSISKHHTLCQIFYMHRITPKCTTQPIGFVRLIGKWNMFVTPTKHILSNKCH